MSGVLAEVAPKLLKILGSSLPSLHILNSKSFHSAPSSCRLGESFREDSESAFSVHPQTHILQIRIHSRPLRVNKKEIKSTRSIHIHIQGKYEARVRERRPKEKMLIRGSQRNIIFGPGGNSLKSERLFGLRTHRLHAPVRALATSLTAMMIFGSLPVCLSVCHSVRVSQPSRKRERF
jgi:hypothetical protein